MIRRSLFRSLLAAFLPAPKPPTFTAEERAYIVETFGPPAASSPDPETREWHSRFGGRPDVREFVAKIGGGHAAAAKLGIRCPPSDRKRRVSPWEDPSP